MDDLCSDPTGWYVDNAASECFSFDGLPEIKSIEAVGSGVNGRCGFTINAYEGDHCTGEPWFLRRGVCHRTGFGDAAPLKSFKVFADPC